MRNVVLVFALIFSLAALAQVDEEAFYLSGGIGFSSSDAASAIDGLSTDATVNEFQITAGGGYMFSEQFGAGLIFDFQNSSTTMGIDSLADMDISTSFFTITPQARLYIEIDEPLYFTTNLNIGIGFGDPLNAQQDIDFGDTVGVATTSESSVSTLNVFLEPGLTYFMSDNFAVDLIFGRIGYFSTTTSTTITTVVAGETTTQETDVTSGSFQFFANSFSPRLGITVMLGN